MKIIKQECIQKNKGNKKGKYVVTLEVTDNDVQMLEDLSLTYAPFQLHEDFKNNKITWEQFNNECSKCDFNDKYQNWLMKLAREFFKLWREFDE